MRFLLRAGGRFPATGIHVPRTDRVAMSIRTHVTNYTPGIDSFRIRST